jgi:thiamine biosynthesis lipoprotein
MRPGNLVPIHETSQYSLYRQARNRMGTICEIRVWAEASGNAEAAFAVAFQEVDRLDRVFSYYRKDSELAHVNVGAANTDFEVSPEFWQLTQFAFQWWKRSRGTFDVTVGPLAKVWGFHGGSPCIPSDRDLEEARAKIGSEHLHLISGKQAIRFRKPGMELDFGGLAKGYAAERAARLASRAGAVAVLVNLGGSSLHTAGRERSTVSCPGDSLDGPDGHTGLHIGEWPVVVGSPDRSAEGAQYLGLAAGWSLSSSASSEQSFQGPDGKTLSHILDPRTGRPVEGVCSATVLTRSGIRSEALTKPLLLVSGTVREDFCQKHGRFQWAFVQNIHDGAVDTWELKWRSL